MLNNKTCWDAVILAAAWQTEAQKHITWRRWACPDSRRTTGYLSDATLWPWAPPAYAAGDGLPAANITTPAWCLHHFYSRFVSCSFNTAAQKYTWKNVMLFMRKHYVNSHLTHTHTHIHNIRHRTMSHRSEQSNVDTLLSPRSSRNRCGAFFPSPKNDFNERRLFLLRSNDFSCNQHK